MIFRQSIKGGRNDFFYFIRCVRGIAFDIVTCNIIMSSAASKPQLSCRMEEYELEIHTFIM